VLDDRTVKRLGYRKPGVGFYVDRRVITGARERLRLRLEDLDAPSKWLRGTQGLCSAKNTARPAGI